MDDVRGPAELLDGLQDSAGVEDGPFAVVGEELAGVVPVDLLPAEIVLIVNEIDLDAGGRDGGYLDDEGPVHVADDDVHPRKADDLVQLVFPLVDAAVFGHEGADLLLAFLDALGELPAQVGDGALREVGIHLGIDEQDFLDGIGHNSLCLTYKVKNFF